MFKKWFGKKTPPQPVAVCSQGLAQFGQREIYMAVECPSAKDAPHIQNHIETLFAQLEHFAQQGQIVHAGDITEFGPSGFLTPLIRGIVYVDPLGCVDNAPEGSLCAILLYEDEVALYKNSSPHRVITRLGEQVLEFPCPHYNRWGRPPIVHEGEDQSILCQLPTIRMPGATSLFQNHHVQIRLPKRASADFVTYLEQLEHPEHGLNFGILLQPSPVADAHYTWRPEQTDHSAISKHEHADAISGGHVVVIVGDTLDPLVNLQEDGFVVAMSSADGEQLKQAFAEQKTMGFEHHTGISLSFEWAEDDDPHWRSYYPAGGTTKEEALVLLSEEKAFGRDVNLEAFVEYTNALSDALEDVANYTLTISLHPEGPPHIELAPHHADHHEALRAINTPKVTETISFQLVKNHD